MECHYAINGSLPLISRQPRELMFRSFKEAPRHDFNNIMQYACDSSPLSMTAPVELSSRSTLLFDVVQASQQLASLNHGSYCASEYSGLATSSKSDVACYNFRSPEETDSLFRRPVDEFEDGHIYSGSSSLGIPGPLLAGEVKHSGVTASEVSDGHGSILYSEQKGQESAISGQVIEKILRDHFQDASKPSSHPSKSTRSSSTYNPTSREITELEDSPLVESTRSSSSQIECKTCLGHPQFGLPDQLVPLASSSEFALSRPTFKRPAEGPGSGEFKSDQKRKQQRPSAGGYGLYQVPPPSFCAISSGGFKSRKRSATVTDGLERASGRPKRRRTRNSRGDSTGETQRITHIAVERNRRKQMNDHLCALKALMPSTFVQKTDQASIIGGAVEFVKELEMLLESLLSKQRRRAFAGIVGPTWKRLNIHPGPVLCAAGPSAVAGCPPSMLSAISTSEGPIGRLPSKRTIMSSELFSLFPENARVTNELKAESRSAAATVEVKLLGNDAIVSITTHRRAKQLVKVIAALESLDLDILHTCVTSDKSTVLYSFNAKVGPECMMTVNQIAAALHQLCDTVYTNRA